MFVFWGPDQICFYNDAFRPSLGNGGKHPLILGNKGEDQWSEIWPVIKPFIDKVLSGGEATWSEDQLMTIYRNGKLEDVYWTFSYSAVIDESGSPAGVFVTCSETTGDVGLIKELKEHADQLNFTIDAAEIGTWDLNPITGKFVGNKRLKDWFGISIEDEISLDIALNVMSPKDRDRVIETINQSLCFESGGNYEIEYTIINPDSNKEINVLAKGKALFDENNIAYRFSGILLDITERKKSETELNLISQRFKLLADSMPQNIWTANPQGELNYFNQAVFDFSGYNYQELTTDGWLRMVHPDDREKNIEKWTHSIATGEPFLFEHRFKKFNGSTAGS